MAGLPGPEPAGRLRVIDPEPGGPTLTPARYVRVTPPRVTLSRARVTHRGHRLFDGWRTRQEFWLEDARGLGGSGVQLTAEAFEFVGDLLEEVVHLVGIEAT